jgi:hypothetical protein
MMKTSETVDDSNSFNGDPKSEDLADLEEEGSFLGSGSGHGSDTDSYSGTGSNHTKTSGTDEFANRNTDRAIMCTKLLFFFVLIGAAAALASIVYVVLSQEQQADFEARVRTANATSHAV